jgi:hypothetical protein
MITALAAKGLAMERSVRSIGSPLRQTRWVRPGPEAVLHLHLVPGGQDRHRAPGVVGVGLEQLGHGGEHVW